jgi:hypothetical protein
MPASEVGLTLMLVPLEQPMKVLNDEFLPAWHRYPALSFLLSVPDGIVYLLDMVDIVVGRGG